MATRPLELNEYKTILENIGNGFTYGEGKIFRPNQKLVLILTLQANLGLRIGDILELKVSNFNNGKLEIREDKTDKLQYRDINPTITSMIMEYALENKLSKADKLFDIGVRAIQKQLKIVVDYLGYENISTHSFRKMFATMQYELNNHNLELVKELLNHSSIATTQKYIRVTQSQINKASANFLV